MGTYKEHCSFFVLRVKRRQWVSLEKHPERKSLVNAGAFHHADSRRTGACVYSRPMLMAFRIISGLLVVTFGFAWTVGQAGLETTNKNLCDLASAVWFEPIADCRFATWIIWLWGLGAIAAFVFLTADAVRFVRLRLEGRAQPSDWDRKTKSLRAKYITSPRDPNREREFLDYSIEMKEVQKDLVTLLNLAQDEIKKLGDFSARFAKRIKPTQDPQKQWRLYSSVAAYWNGHSQRIEDATMIVRAIANELIAIQHGAIRNFNFQSEASFVELEEFARILGTTHSSGLGAISKLELLSAASLRLRGRTGKLNLAADRVSMATNSLNSEFMRYSVACKAAQNQATSKISALREMLDLSRHSSV
jgi:hypothetical protein